MKHFWIDIKELLLPVFIGLGSCLGVLAVFATVIWIFTEAIIAIINAVKG